MANAKLLSGPGAGDGGRCRRSLGRIGQLRGDAGQHRGAWPTAGHDIGNSRDATGEHLIGPGNASRLTTAWQITTAGDVMTTPAVAGGVVYFPDSGGKLWAVSAARGAVLWSQEVSSYTRISGAVSR